MRDRPPVTDGPAFRVAPCDEMDPPRFSYGLWWASMGFVQLMRQRTGGVHMTVSTIGLDTSKSTFHLVCLDERGNEVHRKKLGRSKVLAYFTGLERCLVGLEACGGAHWWGRELETLGHEVKMMSAKTVKACRVNAKNDYNDARAIAEAATRPYVRAMPLKTPEQLDLQALHRSQAMAKKQRNQTASSMRGLLTEHGIVVPEGIGVLRRRVPEVLEDADNGLSDVFREMLAEAYQVLCQQCERLAECNRRLNRAFARDGRAQLAASTPGVGVMTATAVSAMHGDLRQFRRAEDFSAALGLVPMQHSTGGRTMLGSINKRTNPYLRTLFINGARSVLRHAERHPNDPMCRWVLEVAARRGKNVATVALANKLARVTWAVLTTGQPYSPERLRTRSA